MITNQTFDCRLIFDEIELISVEKCESFWRIFDSYCSNTIAIVLLLAFRNFPFGILIWLSFYGLQLLVPFVEVHQMTSFPTL